MASAPASECARAARAAGVLTRPFGDVVMLMPPLGMGEADLRQLVGAVQHGMDEVCA